MFARNSNGLAAIASTLALAACAPVPAPQTPDAFANLPDVPGERFAEACERFDAWDKPARPFQILGNTWYVGTCGIAAVLITGEEGHVLIDSGVEAAAPHVLASIRSLGFDPRDIRYLLMSHEHFDHVAGHAAIVAATGATVVASPEAAPVLESGKLAADDPQALSGHPDFVPVDVGRIVRDGETVTLGDIALTAHATPGHTAGAMSWTWNACSLPGEPPVCRRIAYVDSLSAVSSDSYRFSDHPDWVATFRESIARVAALPCDILVTPHPSSSSMIEKIREGRFGAYGECQDYAQRLGTNLDARLAKERGQ